MPVAIGCLFDVQKLLSRVVVCQKKKRKKKKSRVVV
jgi:hypothetical protein